MDVRDAFDTPQGFLVLDDRSWGKTRVVLMRRAENEI